jgi:hypothetical protein
MTDLRNSESQTNRTPQMIVAIAGGFNTVANHLILVLPPLFFDLYLWLGPHIRIKNIIQPIISEMVNNIRTFGTPDMITMTNGIQELWQVVLEHFNLTSLIRTFPIGLPSLVTSISPILNPFGKPMFLELSSILNLICLWALLSLFGLLLGCFFFNATATFAMNRKVSLNLGELGWQTLQSFFLSLIMYITFMMISVPLLLLLSILAAFNTLIAQIVIIVAGLILIRFLLPFLFSAHGIFLYRLSIVASMFNSVRLVRKYLPGTGLFFLMLILINAGMNIIWRMPNEQSWMMLVGIAGHAFISASLLAASFNYFQFGMQRMQQNIQASAKMSQV